MRRPQPADVSTTRLSDADLCLIAVFRLSEGKGGREVGSDHDISEVVATYLSRLGAAAARPSQLSAEGHWYLENVAHFTDRLAALDWATADSPYRLTPEGARRCRQAYESLLAGPHGKTIRKLVGEPPA
jgi:hypothetical protein